uniref:respiratory nitrate reductase subunit gamma n=1 Tax=Escherichia coli TaxID=562 RepID=UPI0015C3D3B7
GSVIVELCGWAHPLVSFHGCASQHLVGVSFIFRLRLVLGMYLFRLLPCARLVHIWGVPVEYLTRKYQLVRARH